MTGFVERVANAATALRTIFPETPMQENAHLSERTGARIFLKREDLSPVRSYKIRGAFNFFRHALAGGADAALFVCASAGNHAQGFAFVCRHFGKKGVVFMPVTTPQQKIDKTRIFGGEFVEIRLVGDFFDDCYRAAIDFCAASGGHMVPPFDHKDIIEGQATVGYEISDQMPGGRTPDIMVLPVGGGGLSAGVTRYFLEQGREPRFVFCEPLGAPSLKQSLEAGRRVKLAKVDNFVDGAAVAEIGREPFRHLKHFPAEAVQLIPENRVCATIIDMLNVEGVVLEPAGALAIDALKDFSEEGDQGQDHRAGGLGRQFRFRAAARREGEGAALCRPEEILRVPLSAAAGRAARFPAIARPGRRHHPLRVSEEVGAQFRLGADRHRDPGPPQFRPAGQALRRRRLGA